LTLTFDLESYFRTIPVFLVAASWTAACRFFDRSMFGSHWRWQYWWVRQIKLKISWDWLLGALYHSNTYSLTHGLIVITTVIVVIIIASKSRHEWTSW